jgi:hypothetical protein
VGQYSHRRPRQNRLRTTITGTHKKSPSPAQCRQEAFLSGEPVSFHLPSELPLALPQPASPKLCNFAHFLRPPWIINCSYLLLMHVSGDGERLVLAHTTNTAFSHRRNDNDTIDSICLKCFRTIATKGTKAELPSPKLLMNAAASIWPMRFVGKIRVHPRSPHKPLRASAVAAVTLGTSKFVLRFREGMCGLRQRQAWD